jgi:hypothetical protein
VTIEQRFADVRALPTEPAPGRAGFFEYHCFESTKSHDAALWLRSHQPVTVLAISEPGVGETPEERGNEGCPRVYRVRFADGFEADAFEDEVLTSPAQYTRPDPPQEASA